MEALATMPHNLSLILGSTWWKMNTTSFSLSSDLQMHSGLCVHKLTVTYTHSESEFRMLYQSSFRVISKKCIASYKELKDILY